MRLALLLVGSMGCAALYGQAHRIEMTFTGVGCEPCIASMPARAQRLRGVDTASVDAAKGVLTVTLAAVNRVRIEQLRDLIQQDGTKAATATVEVSGVLERAASTAAGVDGGAAWLLRVPQWPLPLEVLMPGGGGEGTWKPVAGQTVRVTGRISDLSPQQAGKLVLQILSAKNNP